MIDPLAPALARLRDALDDVAKRLDERHPDPALDDPLTLARRTLAMRRVRARHFPADLLGEPAWDIALVLFIAGEEGVERYVMETFAEAGVAHATGQRALDRLCRDELVARSGDDRDTHRRWINLTEKGRAAVLGALTGQF